MSFVPPTPTPTFTSPLPQSQLQQILGEERKEINPGFGTEWSLEPLERAFSPVSSLIP